MNRQFETLNYQYMQISGDCRFKNKTIVRGYIAYEYRQPVNSLILTSQDVTKSEKITVHPSKKRSGNVRVRKGTKRPNGREATVYRTHCAC